MHVLRYLIKDKKFDQNTRNDFAETPCHAVMTKGTFVAMRYLVEEAKCDLDVRNYLNITPLHMAAYANRTEMVKYFFTIIERIQIVLFNDFFSFFQVQYLMKKGAALTSFPIKMNETNTAIELLKFEFFKLNEK